MKGCIDFTPPKKLAWGLVKQGKVKNVKINAPKECYHKAPHNR